MHDVKKSEWGEDTDDESSLEYRSADIIANEQREYRMEKGQGKGL